MYDVKLVMTTTTMRSRRRKRRKRMSRRIYILPEYIRTKV